MEALKRYKTSGTGTGAQTASIPVGEGTWEISSASVTVGGPTTIVAAMPVHMQGRIVFEQQDEQTTGQLDDARGLKLAMGISTEAYPLTMERPHIVVGPGKITSRMIHATPTGGFEHTLAATYRRVYP